jgi:hypothetical protein
VLVAHLLQALERPPLDVSIDLVVTAPTQEHVETPAFSRGPASLRPTMCARLPRLKALPEVDSRTTSVLHFAHRLAIRP